MERSPASAVRWLLDSEHGASHRLIPRWIFLRSLGLIYFSAFYSLIFQIRGLIGPNGILPAGDYLQAVGHSLGHVRFWYAPTLLWFSSGSHMLLALCWIGMAAALLLIFNLWPRAALVVCFVCFLSFVSAAGDFSGYQSDGMLLEAGFIALFFAPPGFLPGLGRARPPSRASLFLLQWEWFRIYFESGVVKIASGEPQWRQMTAMDEYYQNGPLPTWIGWYVQHLPHWFHAATAYGTTALELGLVWMMFLPRRWRIVLLLHRHAVADRHYPDRQLHIPELPCPRARIPALGRPIDSLLYPARWKKFVQDHTDSRLKTNCLDPSRPNDEETIERASNDLRQPSQAKPSDRHKETWREASAASTRGVEAFLTGLMLGWIFYATAAELVWIVFPAMKLPTTPVEALEPFRIANRYGLFAVMTRGRYEIEFQGSEDGQTWQAYPFLYKPQDPDKPPGIYAPYQPRFDWNLWFASLGSWREYPIVVNTEVRLISNDSDVLALFAGNPFPHGPPRQIRAVFWQYWFTTIEEKRKTGLWWRRQMLGLYSPSLTLDPDGKIRVVEWPTVVPRQ